MTARVSINIDGLTFGELYRFVDLARSSGLDAETAVIVESTDRLGNEIGPHSLSAELGGGFLSEAPVLIPRNRIDAYVNSLGRELAQEGDATDRSILRELLEILAEG